MIWPFDVAPTAIEALWLALYLVSFALHAVFASYVAAGTGYALVAALRRSPDPVAAHVRDWLPFMLGAAITAGVGPLLFLQLLHQRRFYTANLLLGPRWGAVVPALIVGFYALYLAKASGRLRRLALGVGLACFAFVAWSWTEIHLLMRDDAAWVAMYAAGSRFASGLAIVPRLALWLGAMLALFAVVAAWPARPAERRRLAILALAGLLVAGAAASLALASRGAVDTAHGWTYVLIGATLATALAWAWTVRRPGGPGLALAAGATTIALLAGAVVREAPRIAMIERSRPTAVDSGGVAVFAITAVVGAALIAWVIRTVRPPG